MSRRQIRFFSIVILSFACVTGCDDSIKEEKKREEGTEALDPLTALRASSKLNKHEEGRQETDKIFVAISEPAPSKVTTADPKVIYTANMYLKVVDFAKTEQTLQKLMQEHKGHIAHEEISGTTGEKKQGTWRIRVPTTKYDSFREAVKGLGELIRFTVDTQEVTAEYVDLQLRLKNKEAELAAFQRIFDKGSGKIEDVLAVQREVSRAQVELEQMKGRQRLLDDLIDLTTITIHVEERDAFVPPTVIEPEAFSSRIEKAFVGSVNALVAAGKGLVLASVAVAPWLPVILVLGVVAWVTLRRRKLRARAIQVNPLPGGQIS